MVYLLLDQMIDIIMLGSVFTFLLQERQQLSFDLLRIPREESAPIKKWGDEDDLLPLLRCCSGSHCFLLSLVVAGLFDPTVDLLVRFAR
jgi:hypothetical protein